MLTTIEELADKIELLNENTRELLYKLYLWNTSGDVETIPVNIRVKDYPYVQTFRIPTKKYAISYIENKYSSIKTSVVTKNWGKFATNADLRTPITLIKGTSPDVNLVYYNGEANANSVIFNLSNASASESDTFEFIVTIKTINAYNNNQIVVFKNGTGTTLCGLSNTPISTVADNKLPTQTNIGITYKIVFKYVNDSNLNLGWQIFDLSILPSFKYDGSSSFIYSSTFKDPTV